MEKNDNVQLVGVKEIASLAKVSLATVDRVLHNRTGVSKNTREKIKAIIKELNYQPNILARSLASKKLYNFAIFIPNVSEETAFWDAPLNGIRRAYKELNWHGINIKEYFFDQNDKNSFLEQAKLILDNKVEGIIIAPSFIEESINFTNSCKKLKIPYVFINSDLPTQDSLCYIGPELYKSGYLAARLASYGLANKGKVLVVNIAKEIDNHHHLLRKEEGFRNFFIDKQIPVNIIKVDINQTNYSAVEENLSIILKCNPDITSIFVTNSRVSSVAKYLEKNKNKDILLIGYDFLQDNIGYLNKGIINFLICQKPGEQGYMGMMALYQRLILNLPVEKIHYMPIDIVTKENFEFYTN